MRTTWRWLGWAALTLPLACGLGCTKEHRPDRQVEDGTSRSVGSGSRAVVKDAALSQDVEDLKSKEKHAAAARKLIQAYEDATAKDGDAEPKPNVQRVLDTIVEPLGLYCLASDLTDKERSTLVEALSRMGDQRGAPCFEKTLADYKPETNESDVVFVLEMIHKTKEKRFAQLLVDLVKTIEYSRPTAKALAGPVVKATKVGLDAAVEDALIAIIRPQWDQSDSKTAMNVGFRQRIGIMALGELKSQKAVKPLLEVILSPSKAPLTQAALIALVKIGTPAVEATKALLLGDDVALMRYSEEEQLRFAEKDAYGKIPEVSRRSAHDAHVNLAAEILASLGTEAAGDALMKALDRATEPKRRVMMALSLTRLPRSSARIDAYKKVFEETALDLEIPAGRAKELLASRAADFLDATMVPWLVKTATTLKGTPDEIDPVRQIAFISALKVMTVDQTKDVESLGAMKATLNDGTTTRQTTVGAALVVQLDQAKALLTQCGTEMKCYREALMNSDDPRKQEFIALKAAHMIGVLGKEADRDWLVGVIGDIPNDSVRVTALKVLESLTPTNGKKVAEILEGYYDLAEDKNDPESMQRYSLFLHSAARLRAR